MVIALPFSSDSSQSFTIQLGSDNFQFDVRWNERTGVWVFDLTDVTSNTVLVQGVALVLGADLLIPFQLGIGAIMVVDTSGTGTDAGWANTDLGTRVLVYWVSPDEVAAL